MNKSLNTCAPIVKSCIGSRRKPWVNTNIQKLICECNTLFINAKRIGSNELFEKYKNLRSMIKNKLDSAKNRHFASILSNSKNSKQLWSNLKSYGISAKPKPSPYTFFQPEEICKYFAQVSSTHAQISLYSLNQILQLDLNFNYPSFMISKFTYDETKLAIRSIKSKACGNDGISTQLLDLINDEGLKYITNIFNDSIDNCYFPEKWKKNPNNTTS